MGEKIFRILSEGCMILFMGVTCLLFVLMGIGSLKSSTGFSPDYYIETLWNTSDFWYYFWNSVRVTVPILIGSVCIAVPAAYAFAKIPFRGRNFWMGLFVIMMMIPYQVMISPQFIVLNQIHLINKRIALILPNIFTPLGCYLLYQSVSNIPSEVLEAAKVDGAGHIRILLSIVLPQMKSGIISFAILNVIDTWNMVEQPVMFLKDVFQYPLSAAISYFQQQETGSTFVCGVVFVFPLILFFLLCKQYLIEGIHHTVIRKEAGKK